MADKYVYNTSNFDDPEPLANKKDFILGMTISFMVRSACAINRRRSKH